MIIASCGHMLTPDERTVSVRFDEGEGIIHAEYCPTCAKDLQSSGDESVTIGSQDA